MYSAFVIYLGEKREDKEAVHQLLIAFKKAYDSVRREVLYRVIHKSLRDFRTRLRNNQDRHGRKEHINR